MALKRKLAIGVSVLGLSVATAVSAYAYDENNRTVSCDTGYITSLVTLYSSGSLSVKQRDTSPNTNRYYWAVSSNGNSLGWKATVDGGTVSWSNVIGSNYTYKTRVVSNTNCNGAWPGNGNTSLDYTITP